MKNKIRVYPRKSASHFRRPRATNGTAKEDADKRGLRTQILIYEE